MQFIISIWFLNEIENQILVDTVLILGALQSYELLVFFPTFTFKRMWLWGPSSSLLEPCNCVHHGELELSGEKKKSWKKYLLVAHKLHDLYSSSNFSRWCPLARFAARAEITTKLAKFLSLSSFYHHVKSSNNQGSSPPLVNLIEPTRPPKWKVVKKALEKGLKWPISRSFPPSHSV